MEGQVFHLMKTGIQNIPCHGIKNKQGDNQGMYCFLAAAAVIAVLLAVDVFYTYKIAQRC